MLKMVCLSLLPLPATKPAREDGKQRLQYIPAMACGKLPVCMCWPSSCAHAIRQGSSRVSVCAHAPAGVI